MEIQEVKITDGTINLTEALKDEPSTRYSVCTHKKWGAVVHRDLSRPGGLERSFLQNNNGRIVIKDVDCGEFIELCDKLEAYTKRGSDEVRKYFRVVRKTKDTLFLEQKEKEDIPGKDAPA